jgi:RNA polymerase sigma-70 factor (ECF subfamily)
LVLNAAQAFTPGSEQALARLCSLYWYPLYAFIRRQGHPPHEAEDLTQGFFARLLDKQFLKPVQVEGGRFRSYLLTMLKRFLANERARSQTEKRGGGKKILSIDEKAAEQQYQIEPVENVTPEVLFERRWASMLLDRVMARLEREYTVSGRAEQFTMLRGQLSGDKGQIGYAQLGASCGMSEGAVKVAVHRLRKRYGQLLREEIAPLVSSAEEIDLEIRHLMTVVSR